MENAVFKNKYQVEIRYIVAAASHHRGDNSFDE